MIITDTQIEGIRKEFHELEKALLNLGFDRWTWDYTMAYYDLKYTTSDAEYYLRVPGYVVSGKQLENPKAVLEMKSPIFTRHFHPHGLDNNVEIPAELQDEVSKKIAEVVEALGVSVEA
ncbi:YugN family protein [Risungbinella massiliensis]|uniref:YugN family protein n=1 Tax=Risungbinella massiliensis TaxID=1329796 RepID=UPI00069C04B4|nr:YugN family protein [Risungbinella massiliensis]